MAKQAQYWVESGAEKHKVLTGNKVQLGGPGRRVDTRQARGKI